LSLRPVLYDDAEAQPRPTWLARLGERPTIYVTLGTVPAFNGNLALFRDIAAALSGERANIVITIGANNSLGALSPFPEHVFVARYLPQSMLLPHTALVICHGGASSTVGALAHGVPLLLLPQGAASQRRNTEACVAAGAALSLDAGDCTPANLRRSVRCLLDDPSYRACARRVAGEIARMPAPADVAETLEALVRQPAPSTG
jgi:MGT family glycosyltransferase